MKSYLYNQIKILPEGIFKSPFLEEIITWDDLVDNQYYIESFEDFYGIGKEEANFDNMYFYPAIINFYWVEIKKPDSEEVIRIHFSKGREQRDEFKHLVAFYILQNYDLLDKKIAANKIIKSIFKN